MTTTISVISIKREDFDRFRQILGHDPEFPDTFEAFDDRAAQFMVKARADGRVSVRVYVDPDEFSAYCVAAGVKHDMVSLRVFAAASAAKNT
jgi:hypothetical protein